MEFKVNSSDSEEESNLNGLEGEINVLLNAVCNNITELPKDEDLCFTNDTIIIRGKELTPAQKSAFTYLSNKRIDELFSFLICHILTKMPEDPISFIVYVLDKCLKFREHGKKPPLLFDTKHQEIVYRAMDPGNTGEITYEQYCNGMRTFGLKEYDKDPPKTSSGMITRNIFLEQANKSLKENLWKMIGKKNHQFSGDASSSSWSSPDYESQYSAPSSSPVSLSISDNQSTDHAELSQDLQDD